MSDLEEVPEGGLDETTEQHLSHEIEEAAAERRAEDQDGAIEVAFVEGTLPEADRRAEEAPVGDGESCATCAALKRASIGTALERQSHGWKLKLVDGGTVVLSEGGTITQALFGTVPETTVPVVAEEIIADVTVPAFVPEPVLMRGDGTPLHVVDGNMVPKP